MPRRRDLESKSWRERRWQEVPSVSDDHYAAIGDWLFEAAREAGKTPSLIEANLHPFQGWDDQWLLIRQAIPTLRELLPPDCFPFDTHFSGCYFVTSAAARLQELCQLVAQMQRCNDDAPFRNRKGKPLELELTAWFVDDDKDFHDLSRGAGPAGMLSSSFEVISAAHLSEGEWSRQGLIERLVPGMRGQVGARGALTLVGVRPVGAAWAKYLGKPELYEIELHIEFFLKKPVVKRGGAFINLLPPRLSPTETAFPQALLLPLDEPRTRSLVEPLIAELDSQPYWGRDMDYQYTVELAKPGEIQLAVVFAPLGADTDAEAACAEIERELAIRGRPGP